MPENKPLISEALELALIAAKHCETLLVTKDLEDFYRMYAFTLKATGHIKTAIRNMLDGSDEIFEEYEFYALHDILLVPFSIIAKKDDLPTISDLKDWGYWPQEIEE